MSLDRRLFLFAAVGALGACASNGPDAHVAGPAGASSDFADIPFATWTDAEPEYVLSVNDEIDVSMPTAPELNRQLKVGPDGRITLPLIGQVMAGDRTLMELQGEVAAAYASQLVRPLVEVSLRQAGPIRVFVAGEVKTPGVYEINGDMDAYQAVIAAGDYTTIAKPEQVALIRRGPGGSRMIRVVDLRPRRAVAIAIRRNDIIYVPRSNLGELANFFTLIRNALPVGFSYSINGNSYAQF
ncbi:MAG: polysaccharide export protein [Brevundimonas sp.]|nr:MAG: polysaccharide export protein [Brevundimonas sp.]